MTQKLVGSSGGISSIACPPGTLAGGPVRTRFFDGMFLSQADLETEQRYHRLKRRLTNRALGQGVVWGLRLNWNEQKHSLALSPGYALDCCGNDLIVECPIEISEQQLWNTAQQNVKAELASQLASNTTVPSNTIPPATSVGGVVTADGSEAAAKARTTFRACVVLQYVECPEDARPVHTDACGGPTNACEASRIRESVRLLLVPPAAEPPPSPPELMLREFDAWKQTLPADVKAQLFPEQGAPAAQPASGFAPLQLRVTVPGNTPATQVRPVPRAGSDVWPDTLQAIQPVSSTRPTGVVSFELNPSQGWSLTAGRVTDQGRVVETVTPPAAPSMYWALDVALSEGASSSSVTFELLMDNLELTQTFGGTQRGRVRGRITGTARASSNGTAVTVVVTGLTVTTELAEVGEDVTGQACLRQLVPWGWATAPENGSKIARVLILSALYAFLSETLRRGSSLAWTKLATVLYSVAWFAFFGVNPVGPVDESYRKKLGQLVLDLYRRWCDGFVYPGPRCADQHHGVYLGCLELTRSGVAVGFDAWGSRRYVLTGPLLSHWAGQFGIAPLDVIVGRFVSAFCCLSGLPPIVLPALNTGGLGGLGVAADSNLHVGTVASVTEFARLRGAQVRWVEASEMPLHLASALTRPSQAQSLRDASGLAAERRSVEVIATQLADGGSLAVLMPAEVTKTSRIRQDVQLALRGPEQRSQPSARRATADFAVALYRQAAPTAVLDRQTGASTKALVEALAQRGVTLAEAAEMSASELLARAGLTASNELAVAIDDFEGLVESATERLAHTTVKTLGPRLTGRDFANTDNQTKLAKVIEKEQLLAKVPAATVMQAAASVGRHST